ncbi:Putative ribonuclease H protein At1g65750 [Linum perenne]
MEKQGQAWKGLLLSHAGKTTLLKSVIQAIPTYIMSLFALPKKMINRMNSLLRKFFWAGSMTKKTIHWCKGKVRLLKGLYFPDCSFLSAAKGRRPSWIWASILEGRAMLKAHCIKVVGNGSNISLQEDPWLPSYPGFRLTSRIPRSSTVQDVIERSTMGWKDNLISTTCSSQEHEAIRNTPYAPPPPPPHSLFADDTVIFEKATTREVLSIMNTINNYGAITGQEINTSKSSILFSANTPTTIKDEIIRAANFEMGGDHSKYLGVPTEWGRSKKETFNFLIERMEKQGQAWKGLLLSHAGKTTLLKSVIQAIPTYIMSLFALPKKMINRMNSLLWKFFWAGSMTKKTIHWCKGKVLCEPMWEGGLG